MSEGQGPERAHLSPGAFIDSDHPEVVAFAHRVTKTTDAPADKAVALYQAVRDQILYDPYRPYNELNTYRASAVLAEGRGYCVGKAALLAAAARVMNIPARVSLADVRNHLATPRLLELTGGDLFIFHGITELWLGGRWVKATPTFNLTLCQKFGLKPLEFDGENDAILHPYDTRGRQHMEYVREHGAFTDVPIDLIRPKMLATYPRLSEAYYQVRGDFAAEAEVQRAKNA